MSPLPRARIWLGTAVVCGAAGLAHAADPAGAPVVVARVEQVELAAAQSFVGTVYPARTSDVGSAVDGRVVRLPVEDGQRVAKGEPIAELLRGLLEIERSGATAELERRAQVLAELRAGSRPEELDQARATVANAKARVEYARNRLARHGPNVLDRKGGASVFSLIWGQINNPLIWVLIGSAVIAMLVDPADGIKNGLVILAVVIVNTIIGVAQEYKASKAIESLSAMVPEFAIVARDGRGYYD
jgi:magnesium-transporting ATPase (P-type)